GGAVAADRIATRRGGIAGIAGLVAVHDAVAAGGRLAGAGADAAQALAAAAAGLAGIELAAAATVTGARSAFGVGIASEGDGDACPLRAREIAGLTEATANLVAAHPVGAEAAETLRLCRADLA